MAFGVPAMLSKEQKRALKLLRASIKVVTFEGFDLCVLAFVLILVFLFLAAAADQYLFWAPAVPAEVTVPAAAIALKCDKWFGALGNNILSVFNAAVFAQTRGYSFVTLNCSHSILNLHNSGGSEGSGSGSGGVDESPPPVIMKEISPEEAFFLYKLKDLEFIYPVHAQCSRSILPPLFRYVQGLPSKHDADALVIAIRSGNVFAKQPPRFLGPPPLAFYLDVIDQHPRRRQIVIVSDTENLSPVATKLLEMFPKRAVLQAGNLIEDVSVILMARYLVATHSTFAWGIALSSTTLQKLYTFDNKMHVLDDRVFGSIDTLQYSVDNYMTVWFNHESQLRVIFELPRERLVKRKIEMKVDCSKSGVQQQQQLGG